MIGMIRHPRGSSNRRVATVRLYGLPATLEPYLKAHNGVVVRRVFWAYSPYEAEPAVVRDRVHLAPRLDPFERISIGLLGSAANHAGRGGSRPGAYLLGLDSSNASSRKMAR